MPNSLRTFTVIVTLSLSTFFIYNFFLFFFTDMTNLFDIENNLPDELFSTSGGVWGPTTATVTQQTNPQQQQQNVQRPPSMGPSNQGMGMSLGLGPGAQNGTMDAQHPHQLQHMQMQQPNKQTLMNNMSGGAISGSAIGQNNMNMTNSTLNKSPHNSKLNSPPGGAASMQMGMGNPMGNGPSILNMQPQQTMNNMLNPSMGVSMAGMNSGGNVPMKTQVSMQMQNAGPMGQSLHNGPMQMGPNTRPVSAVLPNNMMQQQGPQQQTPLRGQLIQGMNPQGPRLQVIDNLSCTYSICMVARCVLEPARVAIDCRPVVITIYNKS